MRLGETFTRVIDHPDFGPIEIIVRVNGEDTIKVEVLKARRTPMRTEAASFIGVLR